MKPRINPLHSAIRLLLSLALALPAPSVASSSNPSPQPELKIGETVPGLKTPGGNNVHLLGYDTDGRTRVMAMEYGQAVEGYLQNGRVAWDTQLPVSASKNTAGEDRPRKLAERLNWNRDSSRQARAEVESLKSGKAESTSIGQKVKGGATYLGAGAAYFYVALGLVAAVEVLMFHSNNPVALERYVETLTDPLGWVALAGFMIGAYPFFRLLNRPVNQTPSRYFPRFAAGLMLGSIVSYSIYMLGRDPAVRACMNLDKIQEISEGQSPQRNMNACEAAFEKWTQPSIIADKLAPPIANLLVTGALYYGAGQAISKGGSLLSRRWNIPAKLEALRVPKPGSIRGGNAIASVVVGMGHMMLFFGAHRVSKYILGVEKSVQEQLLTNFSFRSDSNGAVLKESMNYLTLALLSLEAANFKDSIMTARVAALQEHISMQLYEWRMLQLEYAKASADDWMLKLTEFQNNLNQSYEFYEDVLKRIANERKSPDLAPNAPERLTWDYLKDDVLTNTKNGLSANYTGELEMPGVAFKNRMDFVLASMACGPEIEFNREVKSWRGHITLAKERLIEDPTGFAAVFKPPQVVTLAKNSRNICQNYGGNVNIPPMIYPVFAEVVTADGETKNVKERNLLEFIRNNIRASVIAENHELKFDEWWTKNVLTQVKPAYEGYRRSYDKLLNGPVRTAMNNAKYKCLSGVKSGKSSLINPQTMLGAFVRDDKCFSKSDHSLAYGLVDSLRDEATLSFNILRAVPKNTFKPDQLPIFISGLSELQQLLDESLKLLSDTGQNPVDLVALKDRFIDIKKKIGDTRPAVSSLTPRAMGIYSLAKAGGIKPSDLPAPKASSPTAASKMADAHEESVAPKQIAPEVSTSSTTASDVAKARLIALSVTATELTAAQEAVEFIEKNPEMALIGSNLRQLESLFEQIRFFLAYGNLPDNSGPAFLGQQ